MRLGGQGIIALSARFFRHDRALKRLDRGANLSPGNSETFNSVNCCWLSIPDLCQRFRYRGRGDHEVVDILSHFISRLGDCSLPPPRQPRPRRPQGLLPRQRLAQGRRPRRVHLRHREIGSGARPKADAGQPFTPTSPAPGVAGSGLEPTSAGKQVCRCRPCLAPAFRPHARLPTYFRHRTAGAASAIPSYFQSLRYSQSRAATIFCPERHHACITVRSPQWERCQQSDAAVMPPSEQGSRAPRGNGSRRQRGRRRAKARCDRAGAWPNGG